jgi:glutathione S-transferase
MGIRLYELAGADEDRRFSPYCWRIVMALRHKGLDFESVPWRFTEKNSIAFAGTDKVPVLVDGEAAIHDSPAIAAYLERTYPDRPSLYGGREAEALSRFYVDWTDAALHPALLRLIVADIPQHLRPVDADYFRRSREARLGATLEEVCADRDAKLETLRQVLTPLRRTLTHQPFLAGQTPAWADYTVFGAFQWARGASPVKLLAEDDPVYSWREKMLDLFDGLARKAKAYPVA